MSASVVPRLPTTAAVLVPICLGIAVGIVLSPIVTLAVCAVLLFSIALTRIGHAVLLLFLFLIIFQDPLEVFTGGEQTLLGMIAKRSDEFLVMILGAWCLFFSRRSWVFLTDRRIALSLAGCFGGLVVSSAVHPMGWIPSLVDIALFSKPFLILFIGVNTVLSDSEIAASRDRVIAVMLAVVVFGAVFLLAPSLQDAYIGALRHPDERLGLTSAQGFFIGPGSYSWFAAATFAVCYAAYLAYQRHAYLVCAMVAGLFTALSWRRKSILAVLGMIFIALVLRSRRGTRSRALALILLTALVGVTVFAPYAIGLWSNTVREYGRADPFATARTALYYTSVLIARDHFPLGTGLASFGSHASKLYYSPIYEEYGLSQMWGLSPQTPFFITDTYWPMVLAEGGAVTLLFYWSFMALVYRRTWSIARAPAQSADHAFLTFCALFLLTGSVLESTASHFYGASLQATLALLPAGILLGRTLATTARSSADGQT